MIKIDSIPGTEVAVGMSIVRPVGGNVTVTEQNITTFQARASVLVATPVHDYGMGVL